MAAFAQNSLMRVTLDGALTMAFTDNYNLLAKRAELQSVRAGEITAALRPNPVLKSQVWNIGGVRGDYGTKTTDLGGGIEATIETAGKRRRRIDLSLENSNLSELELSDLYRLISFDVKVAFISVLSGQAKLDLATQNLKNIDEVEQLQKIRASRGDISELELLRIQGQRLGFETDAVDARAALKTALITLRQIVSPDRLPENFEVVGELKPRSIGNLNAKSLHNRALEQRPDVQAAFSAIERSKADYNLQIAKSYPDIFPEATYNSTHDNGQYAFIGLSVPLPIFDRNQGEIARSASDVERFSRLADAAKSQATADVDRAITAFNETSKKYLLIRDVYLPKALTARDRLNSTYKKGVASLIDYLDAERTYRETAKSNLNALTDYLIAIAQIEAAIGGPI
ncbi:MAG: TolC family protein [Hyphomicrobium sp.]